MTDRVKVVVVGGGIVGCSVLYWLAKLGWNELLLLEKNELTSGSTWHAAGNVTFFGHDARITRLYVDSAKTYLEAEREADYPVGCHETGSLRLALNDADIRAVESHLGDLLGLKVSIQSKGDGGAGAMTISYSNLDQLDLICQRLTGEHI